MRIATLTLALLAVAAAGCQQDRSDQNIAINDNLANADIEALPPDESSTTPTEELENGAANATFTDANVAGNNSY
jgi:hypothetical protein